VKEPAQSAIAIGALYSNYTAANSARTKLRKAGWAKPLNDFVKLNVDASFDLMIFVVLRVPSFVILMDYLLQRAPVSWSQSMMFYRQKYMLLSRG
jgi:hypothetical protein